MPSGIFDIKRLLLEALNKIEQASNMWDDEFGDEYEYNEVSDEDDLDYDEWLDENRSMISNILDELEKTIFEGF